MKCSPIVRCKSRKKSRNLVEIPKPLTLEDIALFERLPALNLEQIGRVLQKTTKEVYEITRTRTKRPLPTFKVGKTVCSTWTKIIAWRDAGFAEREAA